MKTYEQWDHLFEKIGSNLVCFDESSYAGDIERPCLGTEGFIGWVMLDRNQTLRIGTERSGYLFEYSYNLSVTANPELDTDFEQDNGELDYVFEVVRDYKFSEDECADDPLLWD